MAENNLKQQGEGGPSLLVDYISRELTEAEVRQVESLIDTYEDVYEQYQFFLSVWNGLKTVFEQDMPELYLLDADHELINTAINEYIQNQSDNATQKEDSTDNVQIFPLLKFIASVILVFLIAGLVLFGLIKLTEVSVTEKIQPHSDINANISSYLVNPTFKKQTKEISEQSKEPIKNKKSKNVIVGISEKYKETSSEHVGRNVPKFSKKEVSNKIVKKKVKEPIVAQPRQIPKTSEIKEKISPSHSVKNQVKQSVEISPLKRKVEKHEKIEIPVIIKLGKPSEALRYPGFLNPEQYPVSWFSVFTDDKSYRAVQDLLESSKKVPPSIVKPEEFINYFNYRYTLPKGNEIFKVNMDIAPNPFKKKIFMLRIAIQTLHKEKKKPLPAMYTLLVNCSGGKTPVKNINLIRKGIFSIISKLKPYDKVSIISCEATPKILLNKIPAGRKYIINKIVTNLLAGGQPSLESGIIKALKLAKDNFLMPGVNKLIILSDKNILRKKIHDSIVKLLKKIKKVDTIFVSINVNLLEKDRDSVLKKFISFAKAKYCVLKGEVDLDKLIKIATPEKEIGKIAAKDVKVRVRFSPKIVTAYRLIGWNNLQSKEPDIGETVFFGQNVTALYELKLNKKFIRKGKQIAKLTVLYLPCGAKHSEVREYYINTFNITRRYGRIDASFKLAVIVAEFAQYLKYPEVRKVVTPRKLLIHLAKLMKIHYKKDIKVRELFDSLKILNLYL